MRNAGLDELQAGIEIGGRNINNLRCVDDTTLMAEGEEELKSLLMRVKEESERTGLKLNIKKKLRSWHPALLLHGKQKGKSAAVTDFILGAYKITVDGDYSHEIKRHLLLGR